MISDNSHHPSDDITGIAQQDANRRGMAASREPDESMAAFVIDLLHAGEMPLGQLLHRATEHFGSQRNGDVGRFLLNAINDLETRKVIRVTRGVGAHRQQFVRLRKSVSVL